MCCERLIYIGMKKPHCPVCHAAVAAIGPPTLLQTQHFECPSIKCVVLGFRVENDGKLIGIWLGTIQPRKSNQQSSNENASEAIDLESVAALFQKRRTWNALCKQFAEIEKKTTIERRAMSKLRDWQPKYMEGVLILSHRLPNPVCWFLGDINSHTERISVSHQEENKNNNKP